MAPKKKSSKNKHNEAALLLQLLRKVLPKAAPDPQLAELIYSAVEAELRNDNQADAFQQFCERMELPDLEAKTLQEVQQQLMAAFGDGDVTVTPDEEKKAIAVEVSLPDGSQLNTSIPVRPLSAEGDGEQEVVLKFIPFPVSLPGEPELIWMLAKRENLSPDEAAIALIASFARRLRRDHRPRDLAQRRQPAGVAVLDQLRVALRHARVPADGQPRMHRVRVYRPIRSGIVGLGRNGPGDLHARYVRGADGRLGHANAAVDRSA